MNCRAKIHSFGFRKHGFTLVEVLIMGAVATIVMAAVIVFSTFVTRSFLALGNYNDLDKASRNALDRLSREIRQTAALASYATNQLVFVDYDGQTNLTYRWTPPAGVAAGHLDRIKAGQTTVLLNQCDYLSFGISQRNPSNNFNFYPAATNNLATVKLIDLSWRCSRKILQQKVNIESVQTAKIVMRNH
jgi:Tfp pilus assembly protein FimT